MSESVSSAAFVTTSHAVTDASVSRAPAIVRGRSVTAADFCTSSLPTCQQSTSGIVRGEAEAIRLLRVMVECSLTFLSDFEAETLGTRGGQMGFEGAEAFVSARRRAGRLLKSWSLPEGGRVWKMRRYSHAQLREVARLHAEGLSTCAIAREVGMTHWSVHYHLGPSGSMQAAMLDGDLSLLSGEPVRGARPLAGGWSPNAGESKMGGVA